MGMLGIVRKLVKKVLILSMATGYSSNRQPFWVSRNFRVNP
jgi:hypothetical protein